MGGLLAARVLSEHYDRVTVVERDALPQGPETRRGVPQGRHVHGLLPHGKDLLEEFFPGFEAQMLAAGGDRDLARRFCTAVTPEIDSAWQLTVIADSAMPHVGRTRIRPFAPRSRHSTRFWPRPSVIRSSPPRSTG